MGDASPALQAGLLRVLSEGRYRRVGETRERASEVRVVAATHEDLETAVRDDRFRADLWYRLAAVDVALPPLRARGRDVLRLARIFLAEQRPGARFDADARRALLPLRLAGKRARAPLGGGARGVPRARGTADRGRVPAATGDRGDERSDGARVGLAAELRAFEARRIAEALVEAQGSPGVAARRLGVSRQGLWRKLRRAGAGSPDGP